MRDGRLPPCSSGAARFGVLMRVAERVAADASLPQEGFVALKAEGCFLSFSSSARGALWEEWRRGTPCCSLHAEGPLGTSRPAALVGG